MKNFSNKYIFIYSAALVAVAAVLLSVVAMTLKTRQDTNIRNEKMGALLKAIAVPQPTKGEVEAVYKQYFKRELTIASDGSIITDYDVATTDIKKADRAFNIKLKDQQSLEKSGKKGAFPVYVFEKDGKIGYVIPTQGVGLWGAVYSNIALDSDFNHVIGVTFSHDSETPGLGDKITTPEFQHQFVGKEILDENGQVISIAVRKNADGSGIHEVDAISGGTMTSNGVNAMLATDLARYQRFIDNIRANEQKSDRTVEEMEVTNE